VDDYEDLLERHFSFTGQLAALPFADVSRKLEKIKSASAYNHALAAGRAFFNWCKKRRYITESPLVGLSPRATRSRARVLSDQELLLIWRACEQTGDGEVGASTHGGEHQYPSSTPSGVPPRLPAHYASIVQLLILTGQRRGEIAGLRPNFFSHNQQTICLPAELTKNGREHTFPLGPLTCAFLSQAVLVSQSHYLFPARGRTDKPFNGWSKSKAILDTLSGVSGWTLHDLRRTFRSNLGRLGVAPHIGERLVNHISARTEMEKTYDLYTYLPEMREAMNKWEERLRAILGGDMGSYIALEPPEIAA
jgi:integrase